ncbi:MAG: hypothetical protein R3250_03725 [Melioribacteraceae bacterium]|nr:hypothetical protein [Melioribacteraceae bacterium]
MSITEMIYLFEDLCLNYCIHNQKRSLTFDFSDSDQTTIVFHVGMGFAVFDANGWNIGNSNDPPKRGLTDQNLIDVLRALFRGRMLNIIELEKMMMSIV